MLKSSKTILISLVILLSIGCVHCLVSCTDSDFLRSVLKTQRRKIRHQIFICDIASNSNGGRRMSLKFHSQALGAGSYGFVLPGCELTEQASLDLDADDSCVSGSKKTGCIPLGSEKSKISRVVPFDEEKLVCKKDSKVAVKFMLDSFEATANREKQIMEKLLSLESPDRYHIIKYIAVEQRVHTSFLMKTVDQVIVSELIPGKELYMMGYDLISISAAKRVYGVSVLLTQLIPAIEFLYNDIGIRAFDISPENVMLKVDQSSHRIEQLFNFTMIDLGTYVILDDVMQTIQNKKKAKMLMTYVSPLYMCTKSYTIDDIREKCVQADAIGLLGAMVFVLQPRMFFKHFEPRFHWKYRPKKPVKFLARLGLKIYDQIHKAATNDFPVTDPRCQTAVFAAYDKLFHPFLPCTNEDTGEMDMRKMCTENEFSQLLTNAKEVKQGLEACL